MINFEAMLTATNIILAAKDKNLKYIYCNEATAEAIKLDSPHQIIGKSDFDLFPDDMAQAFRSDDQYIINGGILINNLEQLQCGSEVVNTLVNKAPLKNKGSKSLGVMIATILIPNNNLPSLTNFNSFTYDCHKKIFRFQTNNKPNYFTCREYAVFKLAILGLTAKKIAKRLLLSPRTVEEYTTRIKNKLGCHSKQQIIEAAIRLGVTYRSS